jgi:hypothetical protein
MAIQERALRAHLSRPDCSNECHLQFADETSAAKAGHKAGSTADLKVCSTGRDGLVVMEVYFVQPR